MRWIPLYLLSGLLFVPYVNGRGLFQGIEIRDPMVEVRNDSLILNFTCSAPRRTTRQGHTVLFSPRITDGEYTVNFRPALVLDRRSRVAVDRTRQTPPQNIRRPILESTPRGLTESQTDANGADRLTPGGILQPSAFDPTVTESGLSAYDPLHPVDISGPANSDPLVMNTRSTLLYTAGVPFQQWMHNATLEIEWLRAGCCSGHYERVTLMAGLFSGPSVRYDTMGTEDPFGEPGTRPVSFDSPGLQPVHIVPAETGSTAGVYAEEDQPRAHPPVAVSTGDTLASIFPFVISSDDDIRDVPLGFYDDEREHTLSVFYRVVSSRIDPDFWDNHQTLNNLIGAIEIIEESGDARVTQVVVAGFSSPEGSFAVNDRLAWERAVSVKEYLMKHTRLPADRIVIHNGSADWQGLRLLVLQDRQMPARDVVLDIIDHTPVWNSSTQVGRMSRIMALDGGDVYRYMAEHLFPRLRSGAFIRVYYDNSTDNT